MSLKGDRGRPSGGRWVAILLTVVSTGAFAAECKKKVAGFYLLYAVEPEPRKLALSLQAIPVPLAAMQSDPERGKAVLTGDAKGNCLSCHKVSALPLSAEHGAVGPSLDGVANRYTDAQLRQLIVNPKAYYPDTIMPSYFKPDGGDGTSILGAAEVEDLVAYMKTLK